MPLLFLFFNFVFPNKFQVSFEEVKNYFFFAKHFAIKCSGKIVFIFYFKFYCHIFTVNFKKNRKTDKKKMFANIKNLEKKCGENHFSLSLQGGAAVMAVMAGYIWKPFAQKTNFKKWLQRANYVQREFVCPWSRRGLVGSVLAY